MAKQIQWHALSAKEAAQKLKTDMIKGLAETEALRRLKRVGKNVLEKSKGVNFADLLISQFKSPLVFILVIAGVITIALKEWADTTIIFIVIFINTGIGIYQEGRANQAFEKLRASQEKFAAVMRDGRKRVINAENLVPGDIIIFESGDNISADARIFESGSLRVNESVLTGEWAGVSKDSGKVDEEKRMTDQSNMLFAGTLVARGWAKAVVVNTGLKTEFGRIAGMIAQNEPPTPFQRSVSRIARFLGIVILGALVLIFALGILRGEAVSEMFLVAVSVAVAAIPAGLPIAVTVVLAIGMENILKKGGLVKRLKAAETLGSANIILTDKTGTLTQSKMSVEDVVTMASLERTKEGNLHRHSDRIQILQMAMMAGNAFIENPDAELEDWIIRGEAMDKAILLAVIESGGAPSKILEENPRFDYIPFESEFRFTASLNGTDNGNKSAKRIYINGAPELILDISDKIYHKGKKIKLDENQKNHLRKIYEKKTATGMRMIAVGFKDGPPAGGWKELKDDPPAGGGGGFVFAGFIGFHDPLRSDVKESIAIAKEAGIRSIMVTGDHKETARRVAIEAGLIGENGSVISGEDIEGFNDKQLQDVLSGCSVFARILPGQKLEITRALQKQGAVVAMTGDGVNDAPALSNADIGLALGSGTAVAKEASDIVLLNNSFSIIVAAIEEGRKILDNLKKIMAYLLSTGFSEIVLIGGALLMGMPLPVLPAQILWTNIIEEGFMTFAFAFEPAEKGLMKRKPEDISSGILTRKIKWLIFILSAVTSLFLITLFVFLQNTVYPIEKIRTLMFAALSVDSIFFTFSLKNFKEPIWRIRFFSNRYLVFAFITSFAALLAALFLSPLRTLLSLVPLSGLELLLVLGVGIFNLAAIETAKHFLFNRR